MIVLSILIFIASVCKAVQDTILFHFSDSIFSNLSDWWNPAVSDNFKWKNGDEKQGEKFPFSSTAFVWTTDAWHFFQMIQYTCIFLSFLFYKPVYIPIVDIIGIKLFWSGSFELFWKYIFPRKSLVI